MKITIEPSADQRKLTHLPPTVTVEFVGDKIEDIVEHLRGALIAYGFQPETINQYIELR